MLPSFKKSVLSPASIEPLTYEFNNSPEIKTSKNIEAKYSSFINKVDDDKFDPKLKGIQSERKSLITLTDAVKGFTRTEVGTLKYEKEPKEPLLKHVSLRQRMSNKESTSTFRMRKDNS